MTYQVHDFYGQVIAQHLTKEFAENLAIREAVREKKYFAVRCEQTNEKILTVWPDGKIS